MCMQLDFLKELFHPNQVKPSGYGWKNKWLMQKKCLENVHLGEHPACIQQSSQLNDLKLSRKFFEAWLFYIVQRSRLFTEISRPPIYCLTSKFNLSDFSIAEVNVMDAADLTTLDMSSAYP
ncbi:hypothetical protein WN943_027692 [Citrus x changshan-huyou]